MGHLSTVAMAEAIADAHDELTALERAVGFHLTTGFYPPLPAAYSEVLVEAICHVADDDGALMVELPDCPIIPATAEKVDGVWMVDSDTLVDVCKAWPFVEALVGADQ